jgi:hypothetical protein
MLSQVPPAIANRWRTGRNSVGTTAGGSRNHRVTQRWSDFDNAWKETLDTLF